MNTYSVYSCKPNTVCTNCRPTFIQNNFIDQPLFKTTLDQLLFKTTLAKILFMMTADQLLFTMTYMYVHKALANLTNIFLHANKSWFTILNSSSLAKRSQ